MTVTVGDFYTTLRNAHGRGNEFDSVQDGVTRRAVRLIEQNYTLSYMRRFVSFQLQANTRAVPQPDRVKEIEFIRVKLGDSKSNDYRYLHYVHPKMIEEKGIGSDDDRVPLAFWLDSDQYIWFDGAPSSDENLEMYYTQYSEWPTNTSETHWLLNNAEEVLLAQTMIGMAPFLRDPEVVQLWTQQRDLAMKTLLLAEDEREYHGRSFKMYYRGD